MKITWDNIDNFHITIHGNFRCYGKAYTYTLLDECSVCNEPYFYIKNRIDDNHGKFCSHNCMLMGDNNPNYNKTGDKHHCYGRTGDKHPLYGKKGRDSANWKGGYWKKGIPLYDTYQPKLQPYGVECRRSSNDENALDVKCVYCGKWHTPKTSSVRSKIKSINGKASGENGIYCSEGCKYSCPTYNQKLYPKDHKPATSREVQPQLRKLVLERDNWTCLKCGETDTLHCHHIDPVKSNPIESVDVDNCITLCIKCHKEAHQQKGCKTGDLSKC